MARIKDVTLTTVEELKNIYTALALYARAQGHETLSSNIITVLKNLDDYDENTTLDDLFDCIDVHDVTF